MKHKIVFLIICFCFAIKIVAQNTVLDVTYHGAVGDGKTLNTECLQGVIDELHAHGGGQLSDGKPAIEVGRDALLGTRRRIVGEHQPVRLSAC